jgi:hypothetical protein
MQLLEREELLRFIPGLGYYATPAVEATADKAERDQLTYRGFLAELFMAECEDRDHRPAERRLRGAGFPRQKWLTIP